MGKGVIFLIFKVILKNKKELDMWGDEKVEGNVECENFNVGDSWFCLRMRKEVSSVG